MGDCNSFGWDDEAGYERKEPVENPQPAFDGYIAWWNRGEQERLDKINHCKEQFTKGECNGCKWWAMFGENGWQIANQLEHHQGKVAYYKEKIAEFNSQLNMEKKKL